ncbi:MAG: ATP-binding cassette domain-containing protein [Nonomuraea sp.]|nr:ATP-binding cassette domain-containing protein [Nonomuraea sp.]
MIVAKGLAVEGVFPAVSLEAGKGTLTAVAGPTGSGRTSLLLTLAGRMKPTGGTLSVAGHTRPRAIRRAASLALVDGVTDLDRSLTIAEHLRERRRKPYAKAVKAAGLDADARTHVRDLDREQRVRLGLAMALLDDPAVIVADNVDAGLPDDSRDRLWDTLRELTAQGITVAASCVQAPDRYDHLVEL